MIDTLQRLRNRCLLMHEQIMTTPELIGSPAAAKLLIEIQNKLTRINHQLALIKPTAEPAKQTLPPTKATFSSSVFAPPNALLGSAATQKPRVPINYIWLGGPIPAEYLRNIMHMVHLASRPNTIDFYVQLWVDRPANIHATSAKANIRIKGLVLRKTHKLAPGMKSAAVYRQIGEQYYSYKRRKQKMAKSPAGSETGTHFGLTPTEFDELSNSGKRAFYSRIGQQLFWSFVGRESHGLHNRAAASDLLRLEVLRQMAGYYLDTDNAPKLQPDSKLVLDHATRGILLPIDCPPYAQVFNASIGIIYVAQPDCSHINRAIALALSNYIKLDLQKVTTINAPTPLTLMDFKRGSEKLPAHYSIMKGCFLRADRPGLTLRTSGHLFTEKTLCPAEQTPDFSFPREKIPESDSKSTWALGLSFEDQYHNTWVAQPEPPRESFECLF